MVHALQRPLKQREVAIVGAGPGGLASAMLLAHAGAKVTVYERHDQVGGRSAAIRQDGFCFDRGPTFFLYPEILRSIFERCGFSLDEMVRLERLDTMYDLAFEGGPSLRVTRDRETLRREIAKLDPQDASQIDRFLEDNQAKFEAAIPILRRSFDRPLDLVRPDMIGAMKQLLPLRSVETDLKRYFRDPRTRLAFSFQSKYLGMSPYRCPGLFTILSFMEHAFGIYHPVGGTDAVMRAMATVAERLGVTFRLGTPVRRLLLNGCRAEGVITDDGAQRADAVVMNADFARSMKQLVPGRARRHWTDARIDQQKYSCSTFMMYLGIEGAIEQKAHHTIFLSRDYQRNFAEIEGGTMLSAQSSLYVQNAGVTDPGLAPPGCSTLYVLMPVGHLREGGLDWTPETVAEARALAFSRLRAAGFGNLEHRVRFEKIITPAGWENEHDVHLGAVFNLAHGFDQMLYWRPHNRFEDVDGLYLVGGGTHPGSGLPVIFEGARISSDLLIKDLAPAPVRAPWRGMLTGGLRLNDLA